MIVELRRTCLQTVERALQNLAQLKSQWISAIPKPMALKLNSLQNDIELLKDNFTLIVSKVLRLESKCHEKESLVGKVEQRLRTKYDETCEAYKILENKHEKLSKELNFIKFSNNNLREQLNSVSANSQHTIRLSNAISEIQKLLQANGENLQYKVNQIIASIAPPTNPVMNKQPNDLKDIKELKDPKELKDIKEIASVCEFSLECPLVKPEEPTKDDRQVVTSCELKTTRADKGEEAREKSESKEEREVLKTKKKSLELEKETGSTEKKKRSELAKLVEQQSRLSRINERYLSTDIC